MKNKNFFWITLVIMANLSVFLNLFMGIYNLDGKILISGIHIEFVIFIFWGILFFGIFIIIFKGMKKYKDNISEKRLYINNLLYCIFSLIASMAVFLGASQYYYKYSYRLDVVVYISIIIIIISINIIKIKNHDK